MKYRLFGNSGLRVSDLCLGVMMFGEDWGPAGANAKESRDIFDAFANAGGNFLDTANHYTEGSSEKMLGEFVKSDRSHFVVATKYTLSTKQGDLAYCGNSRKHMRESVEASLRRLNTDYIDILWVHSWDFTTPVTEVMRGLDDLVSSGKVNYIGISNAPAWVVAKANMLAELRGWTQFTGYEGNWNIKDRTVEKEVMPMVLSEGLAFCAWQPFAGSLLLGNEEELKLRMQSQMVAPPTEQDMAIVRGISEVAKQVGRPQTQVALNWLRQKPGIILPIMGARTPAHVIDNLGSLEWELDAEHIAKLDALNPPVPDYPYSVYQQIEDRIFSGAQEQLVNHHPGAVLPSWQRR